MDQLTEKPRGSKLTVYAYEITANEVLTNKRLKLCGIKLTDYAVCPECRTMQTAHAQNSREDVPNCWTCGEPRTEKGWLYMDELAAELRPDAIMWRLNR